MAALLGPILFVVVVVGGLGSLAGAFVASLLIGLMQTFAVSVNASLGRHFRLLRASRWRPARSRRSGSHGGAGRADHALPPAGAHPDLQADRADGDARHMRHVDESRATAANGQLLGAVARAALDSLWPLPFCHFPVAARR